MRALATKSNVNLSDPDYVYGKIVDDNGSGNGTPVDEQLYGDMHQFFERLMDDANIAANGLPDNEHNGYQLNDALQALINTLANAAINNLVRPVRTVIPNYNAIQFNGNKVNMEDIQGAPITSRTFTYNFTGAVIGSKIRLYIGINHSATFTFPNSATATTILQAGATASIGSSLTGAVLEFTYIGNDQTNKPVITVSMYYY